jgi:hypothetical protein
MSYSAYLLEETSKNQLFKHFPPKFTKVIAHHCTYKFPDKEPAPLLQSAYVIGYACNEKIECLVIKIDNSYQRSHGGIFHITWSLDPNQKVKPKHSNDLLKTEWQTLSTPIKIILTPALIEHVTSKEKL